MSRNKRDQELKEELEAHIRMAAQGRMDRGESPADAEARARRELGNMALIEEVTRETWGGASLRRFLQDIRYGIRVLRRNPTFATVAIFTLALGIGASTAIFSVVYGVLLRPLPYHNPRQIVRVWEVDSKGNRVSFSDANFADIRAQNRSFHKLAEYTFGVEAISGGAEPQRVPMAYVSPDFFSVFGLHPVLGRDFVAEEQTPNGSPAALVSYSFWRDYLSSETNLSRLKLVVDNHDVAVVGVMPGGFSYPEDTKVWLSAGSLIKPASRSAGGWQVVGRIRDGLALQQASAEVSGLAHRIHQQFPEDNYMADAVVVPLREALTGKARLAIVILLEVSGLLLLVACANVMNLLLAQATAREGELAVRSALGASRGRLVRQFLAESLLLCLGGGGAGIALAYGGVRVLLMLAPHNFPRLNEVAVNLPVLLFALVISTMLAAGLGIFTALRASSADVQAAIAQGNKGRLSGAHENRRMRQVIMAGQVAITLVLLVGAGLLGRSFLRVLSVDPGFRTEQVVTLDLAFPSSDAAKRAVLLQQILERVRAIPGVVEAGGTSDLPLERGNNVDGAFAVINSRQLSPQARELIGRFRGVSFKEGLTPADYKALEDFFTPLFADKAHTGYANFVAASEGYFRALSIPLIRGRFFNAADTPDAPHAALLSESVARKIWPNRDPLGQTIEFGNIDGDLRLLTIVGVVGDVRESNLETPPTPTVYVNYLQRPQKTDQFSLVLRSAADPSSILSTAHRIINELDSTVPVKTDIFTRVFSASLETRRFNLLLVATFAGTALLLALAGIYGVLAYSVARRTRELGVRIALGATSWNVLKLVLQEALGTALFGVFIGAVAAFVLTRLMQSMLFGISTSDPLTYAGVAIMLIASALAAAYVPARRATRIDPMIALRSE